MSKTNSSAKGTNAPSAEERAILAVYQLKQLVEFERPVAEIVATLRGMLAMYTAA